MFQILEMYFKEHNKFQHTTFDCLLYEDTEAKQTEHFGTISFYHSKHFGTISFYHSKHFGTISFCHGSHLELQICKLYSPSREIDGKTKIAERKLWEINTYSFSICQCTLLNKVFLT